MSKSRDELVARDLAAAAASFDKYPDNSGLEFVDDTPVEVPLGFKRPLTLQEQIRAFMRTELGLAKLGVNSTETFEDSLDLGDDDDSEFLTAAESQFLAEDELRRSQAEASDARRRAKAIRFLKARGAAPKVQEGGPSAPPAKPGVPPESSTPT